MNITTQSCGMTLRQPAMKWQDACPVGNGSVGAMLYGHVRQEQILLNHESLFRRRPKPELADVSDLRGQLQELLHQGNYEQAKNLLPDALQAREGPGRNSDPFLPLGWLHVDMLNPGGVFKKYRRGVDFTTAEAWTRWQTGDGNFLRRCFVSRKHDTVVVNQTVDAPVTFDASMHFRQEDRFAQARQQYTRMTESMKRNGKIPKDTDPFTLPVKTTADSEPPYFWYTGTTDSGVAYGTVGRLIAPGGTLTAKDGFLSVENADNLLILIKVFADESPSEAVPRLQNELAELPEDYDTLLHPHVEKHGKLFNRCRITLNDGDDTSVPNEDLLAEAYDESASSALLERMYHYGRYLLICSSGNLPANLQGVWNGNYAPMWASDYHNDENIQMNYWQACPGNMPELVVPLIEYYNQFMDDYRENAKKLYGTDGIFVPVVQTTHALAFSAIWVHWTAAAGWMAQHFYDYYQFTGDTDMLTSRVLPWMIECLEFYEGFLTEDADGKLEFCPSLSPENTPERPDCNMVTINATMDVAICREVLTNLKHVCQELSQKEDIVSRCEAILTRLPEYQVNEDGALKEWLSSEFPDNYHHRHQSHLYPVFPGLEITEETHPDLFTACEQAVEKRLVVGLTSQTGWSMVHMANIYARLGQGNRAGNCLDILTKAETAPNLFTYHNDWRGMGLSMGWLGTPPFQIDANFGMSAAVLEMLVVSTPDCIRLLPGLPDSWEKGRANRLACRGLVTVGLEWDMSQGWVTAELESKNGGEITLRLPRAIREITPEDSAVSITDSSFGDCYRVVNLPAGQSVQLTVRLEKPLNTASTKE